MGQRKRKPAGLSGLVGGAVADQQKARERTRRIEMQAAAAREREAAKVAAQREREQAARDRQMAKENELAAGLAEAEAITRSLQAQITGMETLLTGTLDEDPYIPFEALKETLQTPGFHAPAHLADPAPSPDERSFLPEPLSGLALLSPGRKRAHAQAEQEGRERYRQAVAEYAEAEDGRQAELARARTAHEQWLLRERIRVERQHEAVDRWAADYAAGKRKAVADYFLYVLGARRYPADFPTGVKVAYQPVENRLMVDLDLPLLEAMPEQSSCEYLTTRKTFKYKQLKQQERNALYHQTIAQMALRTVRSVFLADRDRRLESMVCNGFVDTINTATGQQVHWCLISVEVTRELFDGLDLSRVDPLDCLAYLHAKISRTPHQYHPVQPILEYPWDDLPYADELDAAIDLDTTQNLLELDGFEFERLMVQLFQEIPAFTEVRPTRSRGDGGIDLVAINTTPFVGGRVAIQAKRYAPHRKVGVDTVREIIGSITEREFNKAIVITTSSFTHQAREEATRLGVELYDAERLLWLLRQHLHREFTIEKQGQGRPPINPPPQP
ncbi:restriction endonuclease [Actinomadura sp. 6N118]|uniref:restriction endonuclease n=1 Tax=Actinomadura sp. 6N118 TaxID=3375151 RepID=UPI0037946A90